MSVMQYSDKSATINLPSTTTTTTTSPCKTRFGIEDILYINNNNNNNNHVNINKNAVASDKKSNSSIKANETEEFKKILGVER